MVDGVALPPVEQLMIRHQFGQVEFASEHWFRLAATTLASVTRRRASPPPPSRGPRTCAGSIVVSLNDRMASVILVLREGSLRQVMVALDEADGPGHPDLGRGPPQRPHRRAHGGGGRGAPRPSPGGRPRAGAAPPRRGACGARAARVRCRGGRGCLLRRAAQRDGRAGVRPERQAAPRVRGPRGSRHARRARRPRGRRGRRPRVHRRREPVRPR